MVSQIPTTNTFPKFSLLPTELRRRIWEESLPRRVVEFPHVSIDFRMAMWEREVCFNPLRPPPKPDMISLTALGANYESYNTLNRLYKEHFGFVEVEEEDFEGSLAGYQSSWPDSDLRWARPYKGVRFNPKLDTLLISTDTCRAIIEFGKDGLEPLRFVSIYVPHAYELPTYIDLGFPSVMSLFLNAPKLQMIGLVFPGQDYGWEDEQDEIPAEHLKSCEIALRDYWDTWRDTEGRHIYPSDHEGTLKAQSDRKRWRSIVGVSRPE
ncbi:hypothetical protein ONS95_010055 [Cadophora gregata]|uniref:uncharacterized protein n=1 Tax=Cadophora gregata TaxID=51156 RepID=UPI0026DD3E94|nr:uncharacterized protein ONS95_010055 [Cadophora gregata]KAK0121769.1 hypothetical protein ONS95_010055 [Cadophora gregata]